jgi:amidase
MSIRSPSGTTDDSALCYLSAVDLRGLLADKQVSATEILEAHLARIERINPQINAVVTLVPERARQQAADIDTRIHQGQNPGLLAGLPVAHKDLADTQGIRTTYGSRLFANHIPRQNSLIVQRMIDAGAVTLGKTNTPEFGAGSQTFNEVFGTTYNPYDLSKTPGGSSGGSAAALAARLVTLADGSDMGGSLRNPASFCNVVGFRPSPGRVPSYPSDMNWFDVPVVGPMARSVEDCALFMAAIAGPDIRVPIALNEPGSDFLAPLKRDFKGTRIALSSNFNGQLPIASEVATVIADSTSVFQQLGCTVEHECPDFAGADAAFKTLRAWSMASTHSQRLVEHRALYKESLIWNIEQGQRLSGSDIAEAEQHRSRLFQRVSAFMETHEFLVLPVCQVIPFDATLEYPTEIEGVPMDSYIDWMKSCYYLSTIGLPAISVPCGFTPEGLPVGVQIVGRHQADLSVLQLAYAFQQATLHGQTLPSLR